MAEAIVIGGGIVGSSTAFHLADRGVETVLFDRRDAGRATDAGAGIISPETNVRATGHWLDFATEAVGYYPDLADRLRAAGERDLGYEQCGMLKAAVTDDQVAGFEAEMTEIFDRQAELGHPPADSLYELSPEEAIDRFPALGTVKRALFYEGAARVDGKQFSAALERAAIGQGLDVREASVDSLILDSGTIEGVRAAGEAHHAETVVIAGGAWSSTFGEQLGIQIPVEPQRGQILHLQVDDRSTGEWPILSPANDHYYVCWDGGRIAVGATHETGVGFATAPTVNGVYEMASEVRQTTPSLASADLAEIRVGLRPHLREGNQVLGPVPGVAGLYVVTGHGRNGLHAGPYAGKVVADLATGRSVPIDLSPYHLDRFQ